MQQTENLKLNLIETGDPISPAPLNENAQKLEAAILTKADAEAAARAAGDAALSQRLQVFEGKHFATGTYPGEGENREFNLGFNPKLVVVFSAKAPASNFGILLEGFESAYGLKLIDGGFWIANGGYYALKGYNYFYFAFD